jgi:hypothetical protein
MRDGVPPHFCRVVRDVLSNIYNDRWLGRGGPDSCPPRSPDFIPLDFLCGYSEKFFCMQLLLTEKSIDACQIIRNCTGIFESMRRSMMRHLEAMIEFNVGYIVHLQMQSFSYSSQMKCFRSQQTKTKQTPWP